MSVLMVNESADFSTLKELLGVTDGNLASHAKALESESSNKMTYSPFGRVVSRRSFKPRDQGLNQVLDFFI